MVLEAFTPQEEALIEVAVERAVGQAQMRWRSMLAVLEEEGIRNPIATVYTPPEAARLLVTASDILPEATVVQIKAAGNITLTSTPTIHDGQNGQILTLINISASATITLQDESNLAGSNVYFPGSANITLAARGVLTLIYSSESSAWIGYAGIATGGGVGVHVVLDGSVHTDSVADAVTRGSLVYGNATPKWDELVLGTSGYFLKAGASDLAWAAIVEADISDLQSYVLAHAMLDGSVHNDSVADAVSAGSIIIGNDTPKWDELIIAVPGAGVRNVLGIDNGETTPEWKVVIDSSNPVDVSAAAQPGTSLLFSRNDHIHKMGIGTTRGDLVAWNSTPLPFRIPIGAAGTIFYSDGSDPSWIARAGTAELANVAAAEAAGSDVKVAYADHVHALGIGTTRGDLLVWEATPVASRLAIGGAGTILQSDGTDPAWVAPATAIGHAMLDGSIHTDSVADAVTRGSLIVGNATPKWDELVVGGAGTYLKSDGTDVAWGALDDHDHTGDAGDGGQITEASISDLQSYVLAHAMLDGSAHNDSVAQAVTRGSLIYGNATPAWDELTIGAAGSALGSDGTDVSWSTSLALAGTLTVDTINEYSGAAGLTIEGILLKDSIISWSGDTNLYREGANVLATDDTLQVKSGLFSLGVNDSIAGVISIFGTATNTGGSLQFYVGGNYDGVFQSYTVQAYEDDLRVYHDGATDLTIKADRSIEIPTGPLKVDTISEYTGAAGVTIDGVLLKDGEVSLADSKALILGTGDDAKIYYDGTNLIIDPDVVGSGDFRILGSQHIIHAAVEDDDHALEVDLAAGNYSDIKAIDIVYATGTLAAGEDDEAILVNIDEDASGGGRVTGLDVLTTTSGAALVEALFAGVGVAPIEQLSGTFGNPDSALVKAADELADLINPAANTTVFVADDDTMTIGKSAKFEELEFILSTDAGGGGIAPTFEYSTGVGAWAAFSPMDGTNGLRNTGVVAWEDSDIPGWNTGAGGEYLIRITRTRGTVPTTPVVSFLQCASATEFGWDESGDVITNSLGTDTIDERTGAAGVTIEGTKFIDSYALFAEIAKPANPADGYGKLYMKNDDKLYWLSTGGAESDLTAGAAQAVALLDGTEHTDTVAQGVTRGSLIYGNATPAWDELVVGYAGEFLRTDGTDVYWAAITEADISDLQSYVLAHAMLDGSAHSDSVADAVTRGSLIYGNATPKWDELTIGGASTVLMSDGTDVAWTAQSGIDHGSLGGLGDDDHTQYGRIADAEQPSGLWRFTSGVEITDADFKLIYAGGIVQILVDLADGDGIIYTRATDTFGFYNSSLAFSITPTAVKAELPLDLKELTTPANPAANRARFYGKDVGGRTLPHWLESDGTETALGAASGTITADVINELTPNAGVTIEGILLKDSVISWSGDVNLYRSAANWLKTDDTLSAAHINAQQGLGNKVGVYEAPDGSLFYGLGIQGFLLEFITPDASSDFRWGHGNSGALTEKMFLDSGTGQLRVPTQGSGAGLLLGGDAQVYRGAANRLDLAASDALVIHGGAGDFAAPANGMLWYNTTTNKLRVYENGAWANVV